MGRSKCGVDELRLRKLELTWSSAGRPTGEPGELGVTGSPNWRRILHHSSHHHLFSTPTSFSKACPATVNCSPAGGSPDCLVTPHLAPRHIEVSRAPWCRPCPASLQWPVQTASLVPEACAFSFQDENDNPPTFSKPAYFVSVVENIMAGMARVGEASKHSRPGQGAGLTLHTNPRGPCPPCVSDKWNLWRCVVVH